ncbi:hypothetical protein [Pseudomarimonas salicorniae]|uniref:Secreted protein n=1 Tax=Pseudomarimonas salicorniae TaxID=2933270 RepID=A0ABT0GEN8_9GAMM|nr:hypothetical protein [Lysobacter sp. CAU 1642]MCK7592485.1 hypothetical protein [Lysobacter sp. CAU 1642]
MRVIVCLSLLVLLSGCAEPPPPPDDRDQALKRTIEEPQQRAKAVEADMLKAQGRVDGALDAAEPPAEGPED